MNTQSLLIVAAALGLGGLSKGATGIGLPLIALPLLATFLGVPHAIAVLSIPVVVSNGWQVVRYRARWPEVPFLPRLLVTGVLGIAVGTVFLSTVPAEGLALTLGAILTVYIVLRLFRPSFRLSPDKGRSVAPSAGIVAGIVQGATGLSSPILVTFLHALRLEREAYIFAISAMFLLFGTTQLPALALAGLIGWTEVFEGVLAVVPVLLFMPLGARLGACLGQAVFDHAILAFLAVMAVQFLGKGSGFW